MIKCKDCGFPHVPLSTKICPNCRYDNTPPTIEFGCGSVILSIILIFFVIILLSSGDSNKNNVDEVQDVRKPYETERTIGLEEKSSNEINSTEDINNEIIKLVSIWNQAHNTKNFTTFESLYGTRIYFYGESQMEMGECIDNKRGYFINHQDYRQEILDTPEVTPLSNESYMCTFTKRVFPDNDYDYKDYPSYLVIKSTGNGYVIVGESDQITDSNLGTSYN